MFSLKIAGKKDTIFLGVDTKRRHFCALPLSSGSVFCDFPYSRRSQLTRPRMFLFFAFLFLSAISASAQMDDAATRKLAHDIFQQLIAINTTDSFGTVTPSSER